MSDFEREDLELKSIMGDKFQDMSEAKQAPTATKKVAQKPVRKTEEKSIDAEWHPTKERTWMDDLKDSAKSTAIFGGLNILIWYWEVAGLMDESVALPCMLVCAVLAGIGIGKVVRKR